MKFPLIFAILGVTELVFGNNNSTTLSKEQVDKLKAGFKEKTGQDLALNGLSFDKDGYASFSKTSLETIEAILVEANTANASNVAVNDSAVTAALESYRNTRAAELEAQLQAAQQQNQDAQRTIEALGNQREVVTTTTQTSDFRSIATGLNSIEGRVWNEAALLVAEGRRSYAQALVASADVNIEQINQDLGQYFRERHPDINTFLNGTSDISNIFPAYGTGIKDELVITDLFLKNFLQPDNKTWTPKSGWEFQPEFIKLHNYKVDVSFTKDDLRQIIESWLAPMSVGTSPFQTQFVDFLLDKMMEKLTVEKTQAAVNGVYKQAPDGVPGAILESMNGAYKSIQIRREEFRIKPFSLGYWNTNFDSPQHIYRLAWKMYQMLPQDFRDTYPELQVLMPFEGVEACNAYEEAIAKNRVSGEKDVQLWPSNLKRVGVPFVRSKVLIMLPPKLIQQFYRQRGEDNVFHSQYDKRDTNVFMDGAAEVAPIKTGYRYKSKKEQGYDKQVIFLSDELDDYTYINADANATVLDAGIHNCFSIGNNTAAVTISGIENAFVGGTIYLKGTATDAGKASKILASNANFVLSADWTATEGQTLILRENNGKFAEIGRLNFAETIEAQAEPFDDDDATPSLDLNKDVYMTAVGGSDVTITDLLLAIPGKTYTIKSSGGPVTTIAASNTERFRMVNGDWKSDTSDYIMLLLSHDSKFVEIERG